MQIADVMNRNIETISPDASLLEVARLMRDRDFGVMPVVEHDRLVGVVTDRDIVVRALAEGKDMGSTPVRDAMTTETLTCREADDVTDVTATMSDRQVRRMMVVDQNERVIGVVSLADLANTNGASEEAGIALTAISEPRHDEPTAMH